MSRTVVYIIFLSLALTPTQLAVRAQENQVVNGEFENGLNGWGRYGTTGFDVAVVQNAGLSGANAVELDITDAAATSSIGIAQALEAGLVEGETYPIGFTAKAAEEREMTVLFQLYKPEIPQWLTLWETKVELKRIPQTFTFEYEHTTETTTTDPAWEVAIYYMVKGPFWPMVGEDLNSKVWFDRLYFGAVPPLPRRDLPTNPAPADEASDVWRDTDLSWAPGEFAQAHDVYLGTVFADVNTATRANSLDVLVSQGQGGVTFDPGRLEFGQTYYWRVDEVNGPPDNTVIKGPVWSFATEPLAYPIADVTATSSMISTPTEMPFNAVSGAGLDANDLHGTVTSTMWLGSPGEDPLYIQFEFERIYKLHQMLVWNYNAEFEAILGFGLKDVTVEYSTDGAAWTTLGDVELAQATARPAYAANTVVDFNGAAVRFVRLSVHSGWGTLGQYGLSEVRFLYIPTQARGPAPLDGAMDVDVTAALTWRPGREAVSHSVYLGADPNALALAATVESNRYAPDGLAFGSAYYWRVDEVNEAEAVTTWEGDLWSLTTQQYATIDDFEAYNDDDNLIFDTWVDGWINDSGSIVGYFQEPFAEISIVHGGAQSMPLEYYNADSPFYSEASRTWAAAQDWTVGEADVLRLYFHGDPLNAPETLYVAVEDSAGGVAVVKYTDAMAVTAEDWQEWAIPLAALEGVNLARVTALHVGVGDRDNPVSGGTGIMYIDDVQLGRSSTAEAEPAP